MLSLSATGLIAGFIGLAAAAAGVFFMLYAAGLFDYRGGKKAAMQFLMGQVMRLSRGKADPKVITTLLKNKLD